MSDPAAVRRLGIIADDVTGATDVASAVAATGRRVGLVLGVPQHQGVFEQSAIDDWVVALSTRQLPADQAVAQSVATARALRAAGIHLIYQKYCSTFDSTAAGNIGPVGDALLELAEQSSTQRNRPVLVGTPATPRVGRTVHSGRLFVDGVPLDESSMRDHPLTPMRDSDLVRLLSAQSTRRVSWVEPSATPDWLSAVAAGEGGAILLDGAADSDLRRQAALLLSGRAAWPETVLAGAAGFAAAVASELGPGRGGAALRSPMVGRRLIVAGSCSQRTREQVAAFAGPTVTVEAAAVMTDPDVVEAVMDQVRNCEEPMLISSSTDPSEVAQAQRRFGREQVAKAIETCLGEVCRRAVAEQGVTQVICAGGETSGAVTSALGITELHVGCEVAPGVPWTQTPSGLSLLLKSGNFGDPDLFTTAWRVLDE